MELLSESTTPFASDCLDKGTRKKTYLMVRLTIRGGLSGKVRRFQTPDSEKDNYLHSCLRRSMSGQHVTEVSG